jgi:hypothetical protein
VRWVGRPAAEATWEALDSFKEAHPKFQLEDELFLQEEGSVVDAFIGKSYTRRKKSKPASPAPASTTPSG